MTGNTAEIFNSDIQSLGDEYWWQEGNGSCDCNRGHYANFIDIDLANGTCLGCKRFIITHVNSYEADFKIWNEDYEQ